MKLFFRIIFKTFLMLTILAGCATTEEIKETDPFVLWKGRSFGEGGPYDRHIAKFNKVLKENPKDVWAYSIRGDLYNLTGQYDKAISDLTKAIELNQRYAPAYNNRTGAYFFKGDYEKAWDDVYKLNNLGYKVHPGFLKELREASGRER